MTNPVICTTLMIEIHRPRDASSKRIRFVENILRNCIKTLDKDFRKSRIPQMKGFSLRPEKELRKRREGRMPQRIYEYPEVIGKTVTKVTVTNESDWHNISVKFTDNTAIHFTIRSFMHFEPEHIDWTTGNGKILRSYPFVRQREG